MMLQVEQLIVQLDPPELGRVEIAIEVADQSLRATLTAERQATGDLIRRHLDILTGQFREAGFNDVDLSYSGRQGDRPDHRRPEEVPDLLAIYEASIRRRAQASAGR